MKHRRNWLGLVMLLASVLSATAQAAPDMDWLRYKAGDRGEDVRTIQYLLRARGYKTQADGIFGKQTVNAVKSFQRAKKLVGDGVVGNQTWKALVITVKRGSRGDAVRAAQNQLKAHVYDGHRIAVDGNFGAQTEREVKKFQKDYEIKQDGIVGLVTWNTLLMPEGD